MRNAVKEGRYGVVEHDMRIVVGILNRIDLILDDAANRIRGESATDLPCVPPDGP